CPAEEPRLWPDGPSRPRQGAHRLFASRRGSQHDVGAQPPHSEGRLMPTVPPPSSSLIQSLAIHPVKTDEKLTRPTKQSISKLAARWIASLRSQCRRSKLHRYASRSLALP